MTDFPEELGAVSAVDVKEPLALAWCSSAPILAIATSDGNISLWDAAAGRRGPELPFAASYQSCLAWSRLKKRFAWAASDGTVKVCDLQSLARYRRSGEFDRFFDPNHVFNLAWSPDDEMLALSAGSGEVRFWNVRERRIAYQFMPTSDWRPTSCVAWHPSASILLVAGENTAIAFFIETGHLAFVLGGPMESVSAVAWSPTGQLIATATTDGTIRIWSGNTHRQTAVLEGHTAAVTNVAFTGDSRFVVSRDQDNTVRIWRRSPWATVAILNFNTPSRTGTAFAIHPSEPYIATIEEDAGRTSVTIFRFDTSHLATASPEHNTLHYRNAKVVLVGETSAGKTGLSLVLTGKPFQPTMSTHGRTVELLDTEVKQLSRGKKAVTRETWLWDLAGQANYHLIHQLSLSEVSVAVVVISYKDKEVPLAGVQHWAQALRHVAARHNGNLPMTRFLVAARTDVGPRNISLELIEQICRDLGFAKYFETSALNGSGVAEVRAAIHDAIDWESLPHISSNQLFQDIREYLAAEKTAGRILTTAEVLYRGFAVAGRRSTGTEMEAQFERGLRLANSRGLIRLLSFGGLVLLRPELLDAYASALVNAAHQDPLGWGSIQERHALSGSFEIAAEFRQLLTPDQEKLLLIAMVEDVLRFEIALRAADEQGEARLFFPSELVKQEKEVLSDTDDTISFEFSGPVSNIFATLAVRLYWSGVFHSNAERWRNAVIYRAKVNDAACGIRLRDWPGRGELTLFFRGATDETQFQFEEFVRNHLETRANPGSVASSRLFRCSQCRTLVTADAQRKRRERGYDWIQCNVCEDVRISLLDVQERVRQDAARAARGWDRSADERRDQATARLQERGALVSRPLQVYCVYTQEDAALAKELLRHLTPLESANLLKVLHDEQIQPGQETTMLIERWTDDSDIILLLISSDSLDACGAIATRAEQRRVSGKTRIIPTLLRPVLWEARFGALEPLPRDRRPITSWPSRDDALREVAASIQQIAKQLKNERGAALTDSV